MSPLISNANAHMTPPHTAPIWQWTHINNASKDYPLPLVLEEDTNFQLLRLLQPGGAVCHSQTPELDVAQVIAASPYHDLSAHAELHARKQQVLQDGATYVAEVQHEHGMICRVRVEAMRDKEDQIVGVRSVFEDMTRLHQSQQELRTSRQDLSSILESLPIAVLIVSLREGAVYWMNPAAEHLLQTTNEDSSGESLDVWLRFNLADLLQTVRTQGEHEEMELMIHNATHHVIPVLFRAQRFVYSSVESMLVTFVDLSESAALQSEVDHSLDSYRLVLEGSRDGLWEWDLQTGAFSCNGRYREMLGYLLDELPDRIDAHRALLHPEDRPEVLQRMEMYLNHEIAQYNIEYRMRRKTGYYAWILSRGTATFDAEGKPVRFVGLHTDITDLKTGYEKLRTVNERLRVSEKRLSLAFERAYHGILIHDPFGHIFFANAASHTMLGQESLQGQRMQDLAYSEDMGELERQLFRVGEGRRDHFQLQVRFRRKDGGLLWTRASLSGAFGETGHLLFIITHLEDIRPQIEAEERLRQQQQEVAGSEQRFLQAIQHAYQGVALVDPQGKITYANPRLYAMLGHPALENHSIHTLVHAQEVRMSQRLFLRFEKHSLQRFQCSIRYRRHDHSILWARQSMTAVPDEHGHLQFVLLQLENIHDQKDTRDLEENLVWLTSVSETAASVTYALTEPLKGLRLKMDLLQQEQQQHQRLNARRIDEVRQSADRMYELVDRMIAFQRRIEDPVREWGQLSSIVERVLMQQRAMLDNLEVEVHYHAQPELPPCHLCVQQIEQVLAQLIQNAADAMESMVQRQLSLRIRSQSIWVLLELTDSGIGMSEHVQQKLFEPFFTTKRGEKGIGLGLAMAKRVMEEHLGKIEFSSEVGAGSSFTLYFPAVATNPTT